VCIETAEERKDSPGWRYGNMQNYNAAPNEDRIIHESLRALHKPFPDITTQRASTSQNARPSAEETPLLTDGIDGREASVDNSETSEGYELPDDEDPPLPWWRQPSVCIQCHMLNTN
jgi:hypothetical protein